MSAAAEGSGSTTKAIRSDESSSTALKDQQKPAAALEEDDEFEDFPVEGQPIVLQHANVTLLKLCRLAARGCRGAWGTKHTSVGGELGR